MVLCKHGNMNEEIREIMVKSRQVMGVLVRGLEGRSISMVVKKKKKRQVMGVLERGREGEGH